MTRFYMQVVGMWYVEKKRDKIVSNFVLAYTIVTMLVALVVMGSDFYYSWGDLHVRDSRDSLVQADVLRRC